jgi:hypothetical protein
VQTPCFLIVGEAVYQVQPGRISRLMRENGFCSIARNKQRPYPKEDVVIDLFNREVAGYCLRNRAKSVLTKRALANALAERRGV